MNSTMTVAEVAALLNVTPAYVVKLITGGKLGATADTDGTRAITRTDAEAYRLRARRRGREALEELARVSQEVGLYNDKRK
ncbi:MULTISPECIES: excisionase family DNA-binding protein [Paraburkholderia]|uniref:excisionase family DNA-binding protein n=1 Tax=Paraburkholderia TaxID=1822464 RepID=UPI00036915E5|nr:MULTISPECIES: excisionase family DNA-binding protein [Paraburkholderia]MDH6149550.1 excisionase family DNA binding protein [Paraburkholderia sp. WSM4179]